MAELEDIWQKKFSLLREQLPEYSDIQDTFQIVEQFLLACLRKAEEPHAVIGYTTELLRQTISETTIREAAGKRNISHKYLIRLFKKHVGLSPKLYQRIFRFQHTLNAINKPNDDYSTILEQTDYYDQSHFNREFKQFSGMTPNEYISVLKADAHSLILE